MLVDTSGPALLAAIDAAPDIVKPNIDELEELLGRRPVGDDAIVAAARSLLERGVRTVAVSMGPRGAIFVEGVQAVLALPPKVAVKSTVGAGDAMVAGLIDAKLQGLDLAESARLATAYALGALGEIGPRLPAADVVRSFVRDVTIRRFADAVPAAGAVRSAD